MCVPNWRPIGWYGGVLGAVFQEGEKQAQATKQQLEQLENSFRATDAKVEELSSRADTFEERFQRFEQAAEESAAGHVVEFAALKEVCCASSCSVLQAIPLLRNRVFCPLPSSMGERFAG